jgi:hypothetical protein
MGGGFEMDVAFTTLTTLAENQFLADIGEVSDGFQNDFDFTRFWVFLFDPTTDHGATGDQVSDICGGLAKALIATTGLAVGGMQFSVKEERFEAVRAVIYPQDDAAATTAVAAIRTAFGLELATVEVDGAVSAFAGVGVYFNVIDEHDE